MTARFVLVQWYQRHVRSEKSLPNCARLKSPNAAPGLRIRNRKTLSKGSGRAGTCKRLQMDSQAVTEERLDQPPSPELLDELEDDPLVTKRNLRVVIVIHVDH